MCDFLRIIFAAFLCLDSNDSLFPDVSVREHYVRKCDYQQREIKKSENSCFIPHFAL